MILTQFLHMFQYILEPKVVNKNLSKKKLFKKTRYQIFEYMLKNITKNLQ